MPLEILLPYISKALKKAQETGKIYYLEPKFGHNEDFNYDYIYGYHVSVAVPPKNVWHLSVKVTSDSVQTLLQAQYT